MLFPFPAPLTTNTKKSNSLTSQYFSMLNIVACFFFHVAWFNSAEKLKQREKSKFDFNLSLLSPAAFQPLCCWRYLFLFLFIHIYLSRSLKALSPAGSVGNIYLFQETFRRQTDFLPLHRLPLHRPPKHISLERRQILAAHKYPFFSAIFLAAIVLAGIFLAAIF